jgi:hypothetical protein
MDSTPHVSTAHTFADLLDRIVSEPGILSRATARFHDQNFGNQLLAVHCRGYIPHSNAPRRRAGPERSAQKTFKEALRDSPCRARRTTRRPSPGRVKHTWKD